MSINSKITLSVLTALCDTLNNEFKRIEIVQRYNVVKDNFGKVLITREGTHIHSQTPVAWNLTTREAYNYLKGLRESLSLTKF